MLLGQHNLPPLPLRGGIEVGGRVGQAALHGQVQGEVRRAPSHFAGDVRWRKSKPDEGNGGGGGGSGGGGGRFVFLRLVWLLSHPDDDEERARIVSVNEHLLADVSKEEKEEMGWKEEDLEEGKEMGWKAEEDLQDLKGKAKGKGKSSSSGSTVSNRNH